MSQSLHHLLSKYTVPGPRYTSYPTVPVWRSAVTAADYSRNLQRLGPADQLSLYFHIPFCESLCHFCGCTKVITREHSRSREYVDVLLAELDRVISQLTYRGPKVTQIQFGGGTPNFLRPDELATIMAITRKHFKLLPDAEIAIELNPTTCTKAFCDRLKALGFNRISLGVQDFAPEVQRLIHRFQSYEQTEALVSYLRRLGFDSFNFDLIYGLPGQSIETWRKTLQQIVKLQPNRLAVYSYAHVPWLAPVQRSFKDSDLPPPELKLALSEEAYQTLTTNGYRLIGLDHFALEDDELSLANKNGTLHRNFMGYSTRAEAHQIGFGMSAISHVGGNYFQNVKELARYYQRICEGALATFHGCLLSREDRLRQVVISDIMCHGSINYKRFKDDMDICFEEYFAEELEQLDSFIEDGLIRRTAEGFCIIDHGYHFLRNIAMTFDAYLENIQCHATTPTFSSTV